MRNNRSRGSVLATVLMLTMLLAIITAVVANNALQNFKTTGWASSGGKTRYIAYAGIQHALIKLRANTEYNDTFIGKVPGQDDLVYRVTVSNQRNKITETVKNKNGLDDVFYKLRFNTAEIPENCAKIEAQVLPADKVASGEKVIRSLSGMYGTAVFKPTTFKNAAAGRSLVLMTEGSKTQAFDFSQYDGEAREAQETKSYKGYIDPNGSTDDEDDDKDDKKLVTVTGSADVTTAVLMQIGDSSKVEGNVFRPEMNDDGEVYAPVEQGNGNTSMEVSTFRSTQTALGAVDPDLATAMGKVSGDPKKDVNFTGDLKAPTGSTSKKVAAPPYDRSEATAVLSNFPGTTKTGLGGTTYTVPDTLEPRAYKSVTVPAGQTLKLKPGRYYFADTFKVSGNVEIEDGDWNRGDVIIYVGQQMIVGDSGRVNFKGDPAKMQVYFTDEEHKKDASGNPILTDGDGNAVAGFSHLIMEPGAKATVVAQGTNTIAKLDKARLLGSIAARAVWLKNGSTIEYDTNLADRQMAGASPWRLQGVYEKVGQ